MNPNFLDFEQPIADLQAKIEELRLVGNDNSLNIGDEIARLQDKSSTLTEDIFGKLTSWQIARLARHPRRPYTLDYIDHIGWQTMMDHEHALLERMLKGMADMAGTSPAAVAFWFPALLASFVAVIAFAWVWALGAACVTAGWGPT